MQKHLYTLPNKRPQPYFLCLHEKANRQVLILADSHGRQIAERVSSLLPSYNVMGFVKPGACFSEVTKPIENSCKNFGPSDYVVIFGGANDVATDQANEIKIALKCVLKQTTHTNMLVINQPQRHDLPSWSCVNQLVIKINSDIKDVCGKFEHANVIDVSTLEKSMHTRHGLHLNYAGKQYLTEKIYNFVKHYTRKLTSTLDNWLITGNESSKNKAEHVKGVQIDSQGRMKPKERTNNTKMGQNTLDKWLGRNTLQGTDKYTTIGKFKTTTCKAAKESPIVGVKQVILGLINISIRHEIQQHKMESNSNKQDENITRSDPELGTIDTVVGLENTIDESTPTKQEEREVKPKVVKSEPNVSVDASHKGEDMELTSLLNSMMAQIREGNASLKAEMASHISQLDENLSGKINANLDILNTQSQRITEVNKSVNSIRAEITNVQRKVTEIEKRFDTEIQKIEKSVEPLVSKKLEPIIESKLQVIVPVVKKEIVKETAADIETLRNEIKLLSRQVQNQTFLNCSGIPLYNAGIQTEEREQGGIIKGNEVGKEYRSDVKAHVNEISTIRGQSDELMMEESEKALFVGRDGNCAERQGQGRSDVTYGKRFVRIVDESHREVIKEERVNKKKGHSAETHADSEITSYAEYVHQLKSQPAQLERSSTQVINLDPNMTVLESHTDYDVYLVTARVHDCDEDSFKEIRESVSNQEKECCDPCSTEAYELSETGIPLVGENNESKSGECTIQQRESREMDYNLRELFESEEGNISKEEELSSESSESIQGEKEVEEVSDSATESSGMTDSNENEMALKSLDEGLLEKVVKEFRMKRRKKPPDGMVNKYTTIGKFKTTTCKAAKESPIVGVKQVILGLINISIRHEIQQHKMESNSNKQDENITRSDPELGTIDTVVGLENTIDESTPTKQEEREVKPKVVKSEPNVSVDASHKGEDMELTSLLNSMMAQIREGNASLKAEMASHISQLDENLSGKINANLDILNTQSQRITEVNKSVNSIRAEITNVQRKVTEIEKRFDTEIQKIEKSVEPLVSKKLEPIIESKLQVIVPVVKKEIVKETAADIETLRNEIKLLSRQVQNQTFLNCSGIPLVKGLTRAERKKWPKYREDRSSQYYSRIVRRSPEEQLHKRNFAKYNAGIQTEEREQGGIIKGNEVGKEYRSDVKAHVNEISTIRGQSDELMMEESEKALFVGRDGNCAERQGQGRSDVTYGKRFVRIVDESHREVIKEERVNKKKGHSAETHADSEITSYAEYVHQLKSQPAQLERSSTQVINLDPNMTVLESHTDYDVYLVTARVHDCDEDSFKEIRESVSNQEKECCDPCSTEAYELSETGIPLVGENNESKSGECTIQQRESREMDYNLRELFESEEGNISKEEELSSESSESIQGEKEVEEVSDSATESSGMTDSNENEMALKSLDEGLLEKVVKEFRMKRRKKPPDGMLIELVRSHSELYNMINRRYNDSLRKESLWKEIRLEVNEALNPNEEQNKDMSSSPILGSEIDRIRTSIKTLFPMRQIKAKDEIYGIVSALEREHVLESINGNSPCTVLFVTTCNVDCMYKLN
ncbi:intracellular protein transport protein USO1-like [Schistocerca piceifrons]|uniref:intracellular protein transport protein USO1-like n=1 Tax=Schistocerca piceifrons TaxID=274613 RepID=UPI001F5F8C41|nr:intracellular protein transport protein USO1-like [Schistocerca piceifrons]